MLRGGWRALVLVWVAGFSRDIGQEASALSLQRRLQHFRDQKVELGVVQGRSSVRLQTSRRTFRRRQNTLLTDNATASSTAASSTPDPTVCENIHAPANAATFTCGSTLKAGTSCSDFTCAAGFEKVSAFTCGSSGANGEATGLSTRGQCKRKFCPAAAIVSALGKIENANSTIVEINKSSSSIKGSFSSCDTKNPLAAGQTCDPVCNTGFVATGSLTCNPASLQLEGPAGLKCVTAMKQDVEQGSKQNCSSLVLPLHAKSSECGSLKPGESCDKFSCNTGFTKSGKFVCSAVDANNVTSLLEVGRCEKTTCRVLSEGGAADETTDLIKSLSTAIPQISLPFLNTSFSNNAVRLFANESLELECNPGYKSTGSLKCGADGKIFEKPSCVRLNCSSFTTLNATKSCGVLSSNQTCSDFTCSTGFTPSGQYQCASDATHLITLGSCSRNFCPMIPKPNNSVSWNTTGKKLAAGMTKRLQCAVGYKAKGKFVCNSEGNNITEMASCERQYCQGIVPPANALNFWCQTIPSGENCTLTCAEGYMPSSTGANVANGTTSSSNLFVCNKDATNVTTVPTCVRKQLSAIPPENAALPFPCASVSSNATCQHQCNLGYAVVGKFTVNSDGSNFTEQGSCLRKTCANLTSPANATNFNCQQINSGEACNITCITGFDAIGEFRCSASGDEVVSKARCNPSKLYLSIVRREKSLEKNYGRLVANVETLQSRLNLFRRKVATPLDVSSTSFGGSSGSAIGQQAATMKTAVSNNFNVLQAKATETEQELAKVQTSVASNANLLASALFARTFASARADQNTTATAPGTNNASVVVVATPLDVPVSGGGGSTVKNAPFWQELDRRSPRLDQMINQTQGLQEKVAPTSTTSTSRENNSSTTSTSSNGTATTASAETGQANNTATGSSLSVRERVRKLETDWEEAKPLIEKKMAKFSENEHKTLSNPVEYFVNLTASDVLSNEMKAIILGVAKNWGMAVKLGSSSSAGGGSGGVGSGSV
ncbi:unnamed protein product [Amoebophrya sp. A120]|nr:unnamed protein product [Amoebophrya sp. A120]|eukprot:GSA120T00001166001.1